MTPSGRRMRGHLVAQLTAEMRVDVRPRLVEQDRLRCRRQRPRERDALLLAAGELVGIALAETAEVDEREQHRDARGRGPCAGARTPTFSVTRQVREEGVVLEHHPDAAPLRAAPTRPRRRPCSPAIRTVPASGVSKPAIRRSSVVLPQPDGPSRATTSPCSTHSDVPVDGVRRRRSASRRPRARSSSSPCKENLTGAARGFGEPQSGDARARTSTLGCVPLAVRLPARLDAVARPRRSPTRCRKGSARAPSSPCGSGAARPAGSSPTSASRLPPGISPCARREGARRDPRGARRPRALDRRLLRLHARPGARARRAAPPRAPAACGPRRPAGSRWPASRSRPSLTDGAARRRRAHRRRPRRGDRRAPPARGADRQRQDRGVPAGLRGGARRAASARSCSCPRSRSRRRRSAASASASATPSRSSTRSSRDAERRDERERIARGRGTDRRRRALRRVRADAPAGADRRRRGARRRRTSRSPTRATTRARVAAKRAALEGAVAVYGSATPRPESWAQARADRALRPDRRADAARPARRPAPRGRLPALGAAAARARPDRRAGRQGDPAAQPARRRAGRPLPRLRRVAALPPLRRRADAARRRQPALPSLRAPGAGAGGLPRLRLGRARPDRRRHPAPRDGARAGSCRSSSASGSTRTRQRRRARCARRSSGSAWPTGRC